MQETKEISAYKQGLKGKILEMAMKAFGEKGIRAVKMDDVAVYLGISKRTLYELYDNKLSSGEEAAEGLKKLAESMDAVGYRLAMVRGDAADMQHEKQSRS